MRRAALLLACALAAALAVPVAAQRYVPGSRKGLPRVQYGDSMMSVNDHCPVKGGQLSLAVRPVYVNGRPIGFC
jgi:hypothetical protein